MTKDIRSKSIKLCILEGLSNEVLNSHFRNGGMTRNWIEQFEFFANS